MIQSLLDEYGITGPSDTPLREFIDSLELASFIQDFEALYRIELSDEDAQKMRTVGDVIAFAESLK